MKKSFVIFLSSMLLCCIASCKQGKAESELARLQDSLKNAKMEQANDSISKIQEEQRQQAIADSIAKVENTICEELRKYIINQKSNVKLASSAKRDIEEYKWLEFQCPASVGMTPCPHEDTCSPLYSPDEGSSCKVTKVGENSYKFSVVCPCGCKQRITGECTIEAVLSSDGSVIIEHVL